MKTLTTMLLFSLVLITTFMITAAEGNRETYNHKKYISIYIITNYIQIIKIFSCALLIPIDTWYVDDGCHTEGNDADSYDDLDGSYQPNSFLAGVRCCTTDGTSCQTIGSCPGASTYYEAETECLNLGERLCTKDELLSEVCCGTGGSCDNYEVWTSTMESEETGNVCDTYLI